MRFLVFLICWVFAIFLHCCIITSFVADACSFDCARRCSPIQGLRLSQIWQSLRSWLCRRDWIWMNCSIWRTSGFVLAWVSASRKGTSCDAPLRRPYNYINTVRRSINTVKTQGDQKSQKYPSQLFRTKIVHTSGTFLIFLEKMSIFVLNHVTI